ncbi:hypothetical protein QVN85_04935 [Oscillibacter valericigenes]|nr:hypothetical protein [Oscillibacter valericigenes]
MGKKNLTQGTIIYGIRSNKYCDIPCRGIVISARCDLEQCKIPTIYLLSALTVEQWYDQVGGYEATKKILQEKTDSVKTSLEKYNLSFQLLETFTEDEIQKVIDAEIPKSKEKTMIMQKLKDYKEWKESLFLPSINSEHCKSINEKAKGLLHEIIGRGNQQNTHMCFIPNCAYESTGYAVGGLIVDLQDVISYPMEYIQKAIANEYDGMLLSETDRSDVNEKFFLESKNDFATSEETIKSPWIEWLLQRFALSFMRIGVEDVDKDKVDEYFDQTISKG